MTNDGNVEVLDEDTWYISAMIEGIRKYRNRVNGQWCVCADGHCSYPSGREALEALDRLLGTVAVFPEDAIVVNQNGEQYEEE